MRHGLSLPPLKLRLLPEYVAAVLLFAFARPTPLGLAAGFALLAAGEGLRVWSAGHLVKREELTVSGPYAYLRHPLYLGSLLVVLGFCVGAGGPVGAGVALALLVGFLVYYLPYKDRIEGARLERLHGERYRAYRASVPALLPRPPGFRAGSARRWELARFAAHHEANAVLGVSLGFCALVLRPLLPV